ncbi:hypothetical protein ABTN30_20200, partial [Acinetobacter baumannii]
VINGGVAQASLLTVPIRGDLGRHLGPGCCYQLEFDFPPNGYSGYLFNTPYKVNSANYSFDIHGEGPEIQHDNYTPWTTTDNFNFYRT